MSCRRNLKISEIFNPQMMLRPGERRGGIVLSILQHIITTISKSDETFRVETFSSDVIRELNGVTQTYPPSSLSSYPVRLLLPCQHK